ncbi:hypothetical protein KOW79_013516 [Hemibagrus wyckioides]|uniref:Uncharacterized protein n=1 Tax=Hemibagrus wyckioides TaxID=337641 RepID=A0A9D3NK37_9TELE|nr:hypothetical protein KOW79_013516 [Hemibagrus wyckioides]
MLPMAQGHRASVAHIERAFSVTALRASAAYHKAQLLRHERVSRWEAQRKDSCSRAYCTAAAKTTAAASQLRTGVTSAAQWLVLKRVQQRTHCSVSRLNALLQRGSIGAAQREHMAAQRAAGMAVITAAYTAAATAAKAYVNHVSGVFNHGRGSTAQREQKNA